ncbi:MAG: acetylxylan esterase [Akkermansiaceae bacterium]|nr:acetylxylan esterase [Akkermansiaceae bacterium]
MRLAPVNRFRSCFSAIFAASGVAAAEELVPVPPDLRSWFGVTQHWERDTDSPIVELGEKGEFDDRHLFAPAVFRSDSGNGFGLFYCGSRGAVKDRVFHLGLATGPDGRVFHKSPANPALRFDSPDGPKSILTPCPVRDEHGRLCEIDGAAMLYFSATDFQDPKGRHTLHRVTAVPTAEGFRWNRISPPLLEGCYAPSLVKIGRLWQLWYTDVTGEPWILRKAESTDGLKWSVHPEPVMTLTQAWEKGRLFYPHVLKPGPDAPYLMWYGSYLATDESKTALGFAVSLDGLLWHKHPENPVFRPDPARPWESHYVTSHSAAVTDDGALRLWYASRKAPPFENKYFALNTAVWRDFPNPSTLAAATVGTHPSPTADPEAFRAWQAKARADLAAKLGIPDAPRDLAAESRGGIVHDGVVIEKWIFTAEPGSRVPALLYRPETPAAEKLPAIVLTYGHGGSKSAWQYHYAAQLYARLGIACLAIDPIGEEERHPTGKMGSRAHDPYPVHRRAAEAGRLVMGKFVFDTRRAIDLLLAREDIDPDRIGVAGNSLGGAVAGWMAALDPRVRAAIVCGWAYDDISLRTKFCTTVPCQRMREELTWDDYLLLASPCAQLIMNGDADGVIDREETGQTWKALAARVAVAHDDHAATGAGADVEAWFEPGGGHRPYFAHPRALLWIHDHLGTPGWTRERIEALATTTGGAYCDAHGIGLERLYGTDLHQRGATLAMPEPPILPLPPDRLSVLKPQELGKPAYTLEGWLDTISRPTDR